MMRKERRAGADPLNPDRLLWTDLLDERLLSICTETPVVQEVKNESLIGFILNPSNTILLQSRL